MIIVVGVDGCGVGGIGLLEAKGDTCKRFCRTKEGVVVGAVANAFAPNSVLLVGESQRCVRYTHD